MPNFTIMVRDLIAKVEDSPEDVARVMGLDNYEIFDEAYRERLNQSIVENFYMREIGFETPEIFRWRMGVTMRLLMPVYNDLFETTRIKYDPLLTVNLKTMTRAKESASAVAESNSETASDQKSSSRAVDHSTPQMALKGNADYASGASDVNGTTGGTASGTEQTASDSNTDSEGESATTGYQGNPAQQIMAYRASLINVTRMLLVELDELFMQVWNTNDDYVQTERTFYV